MRPQDSFVVVAKIKPGCIELSEIAAGNHDVRGRSRLCRSS